MLGARRRRPQQDNIVPYQEPCYNETLVMRERKNIVHIAWLQCFASGFVPPYRYGELIAGCQLRRHGAGLRGLEEFKGAVEL
ncbi:hypothetical protein CGLO_05711 [Colletotrichum gloeosporioides Cg-14]|uniref:Uncharacterized protein n=1 Tax=Colletotrichum gloeosporioides (strain Cg-14) TaxID=1237896 RepID=T0LRX1_COLGC|nr:hypothetical protein CGLO_05711 [Colletotrichum gloeosporioides Cg-14]